MRTLQVIPVNQPALTPRDEEFVIEALRSGWVSSAGPYLERFERAWADYCGRTHGVAVCNGTAALQLAVSALKIGPGDEVIMPTFTIISCAAAVIHAGATPIFVDSDPITWTMNVEEVAERINERTKAIMAVHIYGHPVDMDPLLAMGKKHGIAVIEDAAEAHGAQYYAGRSQWKRCGGFGDVSCFSFYANKLVTTGEGGMLLTDDADIAGRARSFRNLCFDPERRFHHDEVGFNFRMTSLSAALGLSQIERMEQIVSRKRHIARAYTKGLKQIPHLQLPTEAPWAKSVYWMYGILLGDQIPFDADQLAVRLRERGVDTRPFFTGMHRQVAVRERGLVDDRAYPVADRLADRGLYLPSGLALTDEQIETVCRAAAEVLS